VGAPHHFDNLFLHPVKDQKTAENRDLPHAWHALAFPEKQGESGQYLDRSFDGVE